MLAFRNGRVATTHGIVEGKVVVVDDGKIRDVVDERQFDGSGEVLDLRGRFLLPGFLDIQVNGGGGVLFNDSTSVDGIAAIAAAHRQFGTTGLLPTLISDELSVVERAMRAAEDAIDACVPGVVGVHIEGPFLNPQRRGVHDRDKLRRLTAETVASLQPIRNGKTVLTVAPEAVEPESIRELVRKGFIVCAGHSDADYDDIAAALEQGLTGFTHLFNAMSQLTAREPGVVGAALDDQGSWAGIIADEHHVSPAALRIGIRCKGLRKTMLVTDAMPPVGSDSNGFRLLDKQIEVRDGVCRDQEGTLAGTALDMATAVRNMMAIGNLDLLDAVRMASLNPAEFLGLGTLTGSIDRNKSADLIVVDDDLQVQSTWIAGANVYSR